MPFKSAAQRNFLFANHPEIAERWAKETPKGKLPYHIKDKRDAIKRKVQKNTGRRSTALEKIEQNEDIG